MLRLLSIVIVFGVLLSATWSMTSPDEAPAAPPSEVAFAEGRPEAPRADTGPAN